MPGGNSAEFGFGTPATDEQIAGWDIDVSPDGHGLPVGSATAADGQVTWETWGAPFHGAEGEGTDAAPRLVGGIGTLGTPEMVRTVGSYWNYATTLFDYIRRAMPAAAPQSLTADEYYGLTAWVLWKNGIIEEDFVVDQDSLPTIEMPNVGGFTSPDPRPDV